MFGCTVSLLLHGGFLYCIERGLLFIAGHGLRVAMASLVAECRLWGAGTLKLWLSSLFVPSVGRRILNQWTPREVPS